MVFLNLFVKYILVPQLFCYKLTGPFNCLKIHFDTNIYFHNFSVFLIGGERVVVRFW